MFKCMNECIVHMIKKRDCPFVVIQLHFDLFGCSWKSQRSGWGRHCPELSISETQSPEAIFRSSRALKIPRYRQRGHTQEPILITSRFHDPLVTSWAKCSHGYYFSAHMEALWVVRAIAGLLWVLEGSEVVTQDEAGVCCVWVQSHWS